MTANSGHSVREAVPVWMAARGLGEEGMAWQGAADATVQISMVGWVTGGWVGAGLSGWVCGAVVCWVVAGDKRMVRSGYVGLVSGTMLADLDQK
ncbi:hypothetical protein ABRP17_004545 [Stenotrophomonas sp. WHRI 8082]|uniref:hypothetical protein n=1 Tax=Stenotrophomonas sp. WHRI 8082 TaxID=3162571 RepID=UPI0032EE56DC